MNRRRRSATKSRRITERHTRHGYWWRYIPSKRETGVNLFPVLRAAIAAAAKECRTSGKSYVVASFIKPAPAIYVFACDHPDARKPGIFIMYDLTRAGGLRSPAVRPASRFSSTPRAISSRH